MTKKEMEKLADIITRKLIESELFNNTYAQEIDTDHEFHHLNSLFPDLTQEELLIGKISFNLLNNSYLPQFPYCS